MPSRDVVLGRIRQHLAGEPPLECPPAPEVWPVESPTTDQMAKRFAAELEAVSGESHHLASMDEARAILADAIAELGAKKVGCMDRLSVRELTVGLSGVELVWDQEQGDPKALADLDAAVVEADLLLADTGSAMIACRTAYERLLCYLPPACIVVGRAGGLFPHMPAAWDEIAQRTADRAQRGEFVFVTGPSRTADIEKILILGVHGPKRLVVLLVD